MKKRIAIPIIAILAILVVVLGVLQVTTLRRFARGTAEPDGTMSPDAVSSASMLLQSGSFNIHWKMPRTTLVCLPLPQLSVTTHLFLCLHA